MEEYDSYVSLGSACETSIRMTENKMRKCSHCFDWIWNQEGGLINIISIIEDKFKKLTNKENYLVHKRWKYINKYYTNIGIVHHNILNEEGFMTYNRSIERMKEILESNKKICFVYFRTYEIPIDINYKQINKKVINYKEQLQLFKEETKLFIKKLDELYPNLNYHMRAFYRINRRHIVTVNKILETFNEDKITYNIVIQRNKKVWKNSLLSNKYITQNPYI